MGGKYSKELPRLIVTMGYRHTGKTTVAKAVAKWLSCPVLQLDDILDELWVAKSNSNLPSEEEAKHIHEVAMNILIKMVRSQLVAYVKHIIIDCSLPPQSHPKRLIKKLQTSVQSFGILIIECKPRSKTLWQISYEKCRKDGTYSYKWHQPKSWDDIQREIVGHNDNDPVRLGISHNERFYVSKLVLDPYIDVHHDDLCRSGNKDNPSPLFMAIKCILEHNLGEKQLLEVDLSRWGEISKTIPKKTDESRCKRYGHDVSYYYDDQAELLPGDLANCSACQEPILKGPAYACQSCSLSLHNHCAELNNVLSFKEMRTSIIETHTFFQSITAVIPARQKEKASLRIVQLVTSRPISNVAYPPQSSTIEHTSHISYP